MIFVQNHLGHVQYLHYSREDRRQGYLDAMAQAGLKPREFLPHGPMNAADRVDEIARMISGDTVSNEARSAARALIGG